VNDTTGDVFGTLSANDFLAGGDVNIKELSGGGWTGGGIRGSDWDGGRGGGSIFWILGHGEIGMGL
jgi:hypothetical protein